MARGLRSILTALGVYLAASPVSAAPASVTETVTRVELALGQPEDPSARPIAAPVDELDELPTDPGAWTLERYLRAGIETSPEIRAARERVAAANARIPQLTALPEPQLRYAWFPRAIQTRTGPQRNRIGLTQMFPWFGVLRRKGEVGSREADRRSVEVEARVVELARRIKRAYFDYAYLAEEIRVTHDNLALLQQLEPIVQRKFQTGASQEDLLRVQMEIGRVEDRLETLHGRRPVLSAGLAAEVGLDQTTLLPWPELPLPEPATLDPEAVVEQVEARNLDLERLAKEVQREEANVDLARLASRPSFSIGLDYLETGSALNPESPGSGDDPFAVSAMVSIPIRRDKYRGAVAEASARREDARLRREDRRLRLRTKAEAALFAADDAERKMSLYRDTLVPRARQTLALTQRAYQTGTATILDWIDTERELLEFDRSLYRAAADYEQSLADIEALCGGNLP